MNTTRLVTRSFVVAAASFLLTGAVSAQEARPRGHGPIAQSLERMAAATWLTDDEPDAGRAVFRATVTRQPLDDWPPPWFDRDAAASRRPPGGTVTHYEFLMSVVPEEFRAGTLYPAGITVDPGALIEEVKSSWRGWQGRRARQRVEQELEALGQGNSDGRKDK